MPKTIKFYGVSYGKGAPSNLSITCQSSDHVLFEKRHVFTNAKSQNSAADIKHRKTHKSKAFFFIDLH